MTRLALASLAGLLLLAVLALPEAQAQSTTIELRTGWNNVAYHGETLPVERALANAAPTVSAVWHWDAATASWRSYFPAVPTIATLTALQPDRVYWLLATQAAVWEQPDDIRFAAALAEITTGAGARHLLHLELADSPPQRARGLMFRPTLDPDAGMLFLFPAATGTGFWMRDTLIPSPSLSSMRTAASSRSRRCCPSPSRSTRRPPPITPRWKSTRAGSRPTASAPAIPCAWWAPSLVGTCWRRRRPFRPAGRSGIMAARPRGASKGTLMPDEPELLYDVQDYVATITLNRPDRLNTLTPSLIDLWHDAILRAGRDDGVRVLVVTGAGRAFCAGAEVTREGVGSAVLGAEPDVPAANRNNLRNSVQRIPRALLNLEKPYLAAVNGAAVGAGMDMASMTDLRIVSERARFGAGYTRMGLVPGDGGAYFLPRLVGLAAALELLWTSRIIDAAEALAIGYANRLVSHADLMAETYALAREIAHGPAVAVQLTKRLAYRSREVGLHEALEMAEHAMLIARTTEDAKEGPRAFQERRAPRFQGR